MKKIILTLSIIATCQFAQAQITKDIYTLENKATTTVNAEENKASTTIVSQENIGLQTALTQLIGGISPKALTVGTTASSLLTKVNTATDAAGYGSVLNTLANSLSATSYGASWTKLKTGFSEKATKAKSAVEVAGLASELINNLKPNAFTSSFNKSGVLSALSSIK
jgi:hypothetical protein